MGSTADPSGDQNLRNPITIQRKPFMLKDYLRDDLLSSCSSSGFKSFPRRQCCITVRFLLEVDLKENKKQRLLHRSRSKVAASTTVSAIQRASKAVISAFKKQLPLELLKSPSPSAQNIGRKVTVPISLWRKLFFRQNLFGKTNKEEGGIRRWRLFREMLSEKDKESDRDTNDSSSTIVKRRVLSSGYRWAETRSEFTSSELTRRPSSGKSESSSENDVAVGKFVLPENKDSNNVGPTVGDCEDSISGATTTTYTGANKEEWPNEEEKEQFSPVSVLDFPFEDEDTDAPNFQINPACIEGSGSGSKQKRMHKTRRFESCLAQTEPVNLEKRIASLSEPNHETPESLEQPRSMPTTLDNHMFEDIEYKQQQTEQNCQELFHLIDMSTTKRSTNGAIIMAENPRLLDFLSERLEENNASASTARGKCNGFEHELLSKVGEDWLRWNPGPLELVLGWEVQDARKVYLRDMEKGGKWMMTLVEEKAVVALDTEVEVWTCLLNELVLDLFFS